MNLTRQVLHDLLWTHTATRVAAALGISSSSLAKTCKRRGIPKPERGHWQQVANGRDLLITPLPPVDVELPLPWTATPEIELLLQRAAGSAAVGNGRQVGFVATEASALRPCTFVPPSPLPLPPPPSPRPGEHQLPGPSSSVALGSGVAPSDASQMAARARDIQACEQFCAEVLSVARIQPIAVGEVMESWVTAARRLCRERDPMAVLIEQCTHLARGKLSFPWVSVAEPKESNLASGCGTGNVELGKGPSMPQL
jgi:hypothetical protein